jgi:hypothetical protein
MAQAKIIPITAARRPATASNVIDFQAARRAALLRRLWADHNPDGSAR